MVNGVKISASARRLVRFEDDEVIVGRHDFPANDVLRVGTYRSAVKVVTVDGTCYVYRDVLVERDDLGMDPLGRTVASAWSAYGMRYETLGGAFAAVDCRSKEMK